MRSKHGTWRAVDALTSSNAVTSVGQLLGHKKVIQAKCLRSERHAKTTMMTFL